MLRQGVLPRQRHLLTQQLSRQKCMEENFLKVHGKGHIFGMLSLALIPASPGPARRSAWQVRTFRQTAILPIRRVLPARRAELLSPPRQRWVSLFHSSSAVGAAQKSSSALRPPPMRGFPPQYAHNARLEETSGIIIVLFGYAIFLRPQSKRRRRDHRLAHAEGEQTGVPNTRGFCVLGWECEDGSVGKLAN